MGNVPPRVAELIETFDRNIEAYRSQQYNETQLRREFIDPFFEELGWDVTNIAGNAQAYKDVIHEDAIKVGGATKAPDYSFRIGGTRKFFLEAKKPSIDIKGDPHPAYQLRRYAWSAKLPLSILTDFEEFAVYDCQTRPKQTDKAGTARIMYLNYKEYVKRWSDIETIFSKDAIYKGSFDKFAVSTKGKRGTTTVDKEFLEEIEKWRADLARIIALRNRALSKDEINFAVQRTIDRIIFLRMAEDRGIEQYGRLQAISSGDQTYPRLCELFEKADHKYNSGLFYFQKEAGRPEGPDELTLNLAVDDNPLKYILHSLYYPQCPYEFSVLPPEILGNVYEQFLGKVIRITPGHRAVVEEKPEVKKAGGVYYTPAYIVDYIVKNTVGRLLECHCEEPALQATRQSQKFLAPSTAGGSPKKPALSTAEGSKSLTPKQISNLRILDPACGSGSFLLGAYTYLLNYHRDWYVENNPKKHTKKIYQGKGGQWFLTISEKKQILLNNIFGVDIDSQAVEVTKLSLLLKVLEGETSETIGQTYKIFHERALPDLGNNIKCGNSLIGPDFYDTAVIPSEVEESIKNSLSDELRRRINPFDYKTEFPQIFSGKNPGFDAVIGNPPYVRQEILGQDHKDYFSSHYKTFAGAADIYVYFVERGISLLNKNGHFAYIVANKWLRTSYGKPLRQWLKNQCVEEIVDFGDLPVFQKATTYPCILHVSNRPPKKRFGAALIPDLNFPDLSQYTCNLEFEVDLSALSDNRWLLVNVREQELIKKLSLIGTTLSKYAGGSIYRGVVTGLNDAFVIDAETREKLIREHTSSADIIKPFLTGKDVKRYKKLEPIKYLIFTRRGTDIHKYPAVKRYLLKYKDRLIPKPPGWKGAKWVGRKPGTYKWYEIQDTIEYYKQFDVPKIIYPNICKSPEYTFDTNGFYTNQKCFIIATSDKYLLGLLNSSLTKFLYVSILPKLRGGFFEPGYAFVKDFPIRTIDFGNPDDKAKHDKMVKLVDRILDLHKRLTVAKVPAEKTRIQRQINTTDKQIDKLTYELYALTQDEIKIIEESNQRS